MKIIIFLAVFATTLWSCNQINPYFVLEGRVLNVAEGSSVILEPTYDDLYYSPNLTDSTAIRNGKFEFQLSKAEIPQPYYLEIDGIPTDIFILETGKLTLTIDSLYSRVKPKIKGLSHNLHKDSLLFNQKTSLINHWFNKSYDSVKSLDLDLPRLESEMIQLRKSYTKKKNHQLLHFVQNHPNSYFAFWELVSALQWNDYFPEYEKTFNSFSEEIRGSHAAKVFQTKLSEAKMRTVGGIFPVFTLKDSLLQELKLDIKSENNSYTLIDFWFSHCQPCIKQFHEYKNLYNSYREAGFEIISISTDSEANADFWKKTIIKHRLPWVNFIDNNYFAAKRMNITKYPTNFLINQQGEIVAKDLSLVELRGFLETRFKL